MQDDTTSSPGDMPAILRYLPPELLTLALSELAVVDIAAFRATSRACRDIVDAAESAIYEAIAKRKYDMGMPCTASDSGIRIDTIRYADGDAGDVPTSAGSDAGAYTVHEMDSRLATAIANQRTASRFYEGAESWLELVKRKKRVNERWRTGMPRRTYVTPQLGRRPDPEMGVWRFKVDPDRKLIVYSTMSLSSIGYWGLLLTTPTDPESREAAQRVSPFATNAHPYSHVEYTNSHLVVIGRASLDVWRWTSGESDTGRASSLQQLYSSPLPYRVSSYKARFPYLVAEAAMDSKVLLIDIRTGALVRMYDSEAALQSYVELDKDTLFLANTSLYGIDQASGRTIDFLSQAWYPAESPVVLRSQRWHAVHHSLDGEHLIAVGDGPELIWVRNYRQHFFAELPAGASPAAIEDRKRRAFESVVVMSYSYPLNEGSIIIDNLCVENGRVVFTASEPSDFPAIILLELSAWTSHVEFRNCPSTHFRVLSGAFPTGADGISRVEMDSTAIYVTSRVSEDTSDRPDFEVPYPPAWNVWVSRDLSGAELCPIEHDLVYWGDQYAEAHHAGTYIDGPDTPSMNELADDSRNSSIRIYDFTKDEDPELCHPDLPGAAGGQQRSEQTGGPISMTQEQIDHMLLHFASS